jgi:hypothetical protein
VGKRFVGGGKMNIKKLDNDNLHEYNKLVDISAEGTIFHKTWWLNIFKEYYGNSYNPEFYGTFENGSLVAGIPIPIHNKLGIKFSYHPKLTPYLGSFFMDKGIEKRYREISWKNRINEEFAKVLKEKGIFLYHSFSHNHINLLPFKWQGFDIGVHYTYILKLDDLSRVWQDMDRKRRNDVNRCYKQNYTIQFGEIKEYIKLNKQTMKRQNHKILSEKIWMKVFNECKKRNCCEVFTAYKDNETIASLFLVWDTKRSYYIGGGINEKTQGKMSLLTWEAIKYTKEKLNLNEFDFEGSGVRSIEFYFRKFGGEITPIFFISENSIKKSILMGVYNLFSRLHGGVNKNEK